MTTSFPYSYDYQPPAPVVTLTVRWRDQQLTLSALVDSGADATMLPAGVLQRIGAEYVESLLNQLIVTLDGIGGVVEVS